MSIFDKFNRKEPLPGSPRVLQKKSAHPAVKKAASLGGVTAEPLDNRPKRPSLLEFTFMVLYRRLYILGITVLRRMKRFSRRFRLFRSKVRGGMLAFITRIGHAIRRFFIDFVNRLKAPFLRIKRTYIEVRPDIINKRLQGVFPWRSYLTVLEMVGRLLLKIITTIFNYAAPVAAALILITVVQRHLGETMILVVNYRDNVIGYIYNESEFTAATQDVHSRVTLDGTSAFALATPSYELMTLSEFKERQSASQIPSDAGYLDEDKLPDVLIKASDTDVEEAYGLFVNNRLVGAVLDKDPVLDLFNNIKEENYSGKPDEEIKFSKKIELKPALYPRSSVRSEDYILGILNGNETQTEIYVVQEGDTPTGIADKTGIPYDILKELNPDIEDDLKPGKELFTQIAKPYLSVTSTYTDIQVEEMPFETVEVENALYAKSYREVLQEGKDGERRVTYSVTTENGLEKNRVELSSEVIKAAVNEKVEVGVENAVITPSTPSGLGNVQNQPVTPGTTQPPAGSKPPSTEPKPGGFIWPVGGSGGYISCYVGGYPGHNGIDIAVIGGTGTPILAAASGTVVGVKYQNIGYGYQVLIDHGNGFQTRYAHNSAIYVQVGDKVGQGQVIAAMGRTGNATGVHCHFEVIQNGRTVNPINYVGK